MTFPPRTEANLATLTPATRVLAVRFLASCVTLLTPKGLEARVISGLRTYAEQDKLFAQGRTVPPIGKKFIVTNARGGFSNHNFGTAFDIGIFVLGATKYFEEHAAYSRLGPIGEAAGLEWGGRWRSPVDLPHYQLPGMNLAQLRAKKARGEAIA